MSLIPIDGQCLSRWGLEFIRCLSGFYHDLLEEVSKRSRSKFGRLPLLGKACHCFSVCHMKDNGSQPSLLHSSRL